MADFTRLFLLNITKKKFWIDRIQFNQYKKQVLFLSICFFITIFARNEIR